MKQTKNYKLKLPEQADNIDIDVLDANFTELDAELAKNNKSASDHAKDTKNPHEVTAEQLGLDKVENKSSADIRKEITKENVMNALGTSPAFNAPTAKTPDEDDNSQRLATTAFVTQAIENLKLLIGADYISNVIKSVNIIISRIVNKGHSEYPYYSVGCTGCTLVSGEHINNPNPTWVSYGPRWDNPSLPFRIGIDKNKTVITPVSAATLNSGILAAEKTLSDSYAYIVVYGSEPFEDMSEEYADDYAEYAEFETTINLR